MFFLIVNSKDYCVLCDMGYRKGAFLCFLFLFLSLLLKLLLLLIISLRFLFSYAIIGLSCNAFFSLGFGRALFNFSASRILGLFAISSFDIDKVSLVTSDILLN